MGLKIFLIIQSSRVVRVLPSWSNIIKRLSIVNIFRSRQVYTTTQFYLVPNHNNNAITIRRKFHRPISIALNKLSKQSSGRTWRILRYYHQVGESPLKFSEEQSYSITRYLLHTYTHFPVRPYFITLRGPSIRCFFKKLFQTSSIKVTLRQWTYNRRQFPPENIRYI